jgi:hypothetical protein
VSKVQRQTLGAMLPLPSPRLPPPPLVRILADAPAASSTSLAPALIPRPAATSPSSPASAVAPLSPCSGPGGRTKAQRWCDEGGRSPTGALVRGAARRSFKEVLLASPSPGGAAGGWIRVECRRARRGAAGLSKLSPRPVPVDLRGKCFNCFSSSHRAAACRSSVRCFSCRRPGHRVLSCPSRRSSQSLPRPVRVWRPVVKAAAPLPGRAQEWRPVSRVSSSAVTPTGAMETSLPGGLKKRTRRGQRRRKGAGGMHVDSGLVASGSLPVAPARLVRFLRRSREVDQAEADLRRVLVVTVLGPGSSDCAAVVLEKLASRISLEADALHIRRAASNSFFVFFPSEDLASRALLDGQSLFVPPVRLHLRRWSRQTSASGGGSLPIFKDIELEGVPAHLWGVETAVLLLDGLCMVQGLHPDSVGSVDLSVLRIRAWCFSPDGLPAVLELHVQEPTVVADDGTIAPRTLVYPISVRAIPPGDSPDVSMSEFLPPVVDDGDDSDQSQQRRRLIGHHSVSSARSSVLSRLGPRVSSSAAAGSVDVATLQMVSAVELAVPGSAEPANDVFLPSASVDELIVPGSAVPVDVLPSVSVDGLAVPGSVVPVDAVFLPSAVDELTAPGSAEPVDAATLPNVLDASVVESLAPGSAVPVDAVTLPSAPAAAVDSNFYPTVLGGADVNIADPFGPSLNLLGRAGPLLNCWLSAKPPCFKVYSRRQKTLTVENLVLSPQLQDFRNDIVLPTAQLLPNPPLSVKRRKLLPSNFRPRRSRRVAKFPPELGSESAAKVCRLLGFCDDQENISFQDARKYARLFDAALSSDHVAALAALFGWEVPPGVQA